MDKKLRAALDKVIQADAKLRASTDELNDALSELGNLLAERAKKPEQS